MAVLATSPAMAADTHVYTDTVHTITGDSEGNACLDSDYSSSGQYYKRVQTKQGGLFGWGAEYEYHHHGNLAMTGTVTNRIETGLFHNGIASPSANITVNTEYDVKMLTDSGVNIIAGNAAELKDTLTVLIENNKDALGSLQEYSDSIAGLLLPTETKAPTVKAGRDVLMEGPGNAVMLGSSVTGNTITMTNEGTGITSAAAIVGGLLEGIHDYNVFVTSIDIKEKLDSTLQTYLAPLQDIKGNFNIVQGSTIGNANTVNVTMHADVAGKTIPAGTSALGANIVLGGSTITAQNVDLTGMASVVSNIPFKDAFDKLANSSSSSGVGIELVQELISTGQATKLEATAGDLDLGSEFNVVLGGGADATEGVSLTANAGAVNMTGALNVVGGNTTIKAKDINLVPTQTTTINALANDLKSFIDISSITGGTLGGLADQEISAGIVAGGTNMEATNNIKTDGTLGLVLNTPVSDVMSSLVEYMNSTNKDETWMIYNMLQKGTATTVTSTNGNIELGAQFNLAHGGGFTETAGANVLKISAANGAVNINGTLNVVSGNTTVDAQNINMNGERLPQDMAGVANDVIGSIAGDLVGNNSGISGMLNKLVTKGNANMVVGGATLTASQGITMNGVANAVFDTEIVDLVEAFMERNTGALEEGSNKLTTLHTTTGNIDLLGRLNMVNGSYVLLQADAGNVNLQGNMSLVSGGAKVNATNININTDESSKYKMYVDSDELGAIIPADSALGKLIPASVSNVGVNAGIIAGGAALTADQNITMGGTLGLVMNTPMADVMTEVVSYLDHQQETWMVYQLLQKGTATTVTSTNGDIEVGAQFNLAHGGGFTATAGENALVISAANGAVNINGTLNVVSGNTTVDAQTINMNGERLPQDMADVANGVIGSIAGDLVGNNSGISGMLNKLVTKGNANMVVGGATLTASQGITMNGVANAVFDTEIVDLVEAFMERNTGALEEGSNKLTTLHTTTGNIDLLGRLNMVNGSYVLLQADAGNVNLQGNMSLVSGGAKVNATNININTDESSKYKMYVDSDELGAIIPAGSPFAQLIPGSISNVGVNAAVVTGGAKLTAKDNIKIGGTLGLVMNTPMADVMTEVVSYLDHQQETWMVYQLLQKGTATTVTANNGDIEVGAQFNLLHGGGFTANAGENALVISAANGAVNVEGTFNVISGNTQVTAQEINMTGEILPTDMKEVADGVVDSVVDSFIGELPGAADNLLDRLVAKGNANMVTGGATLTATGANGITMSGAANAVIDTELTDVFEAFMERSTKPLEEGGNHQTTLKSAGNINMLGRLNVVNGSYVKLDAAQDVNLKGTLNMVSGGAKVHGNNINLVGQQNLGLDWDSLLPGDVGNYMDQMGVTDKLNKGVNGNLVLGGAMIEAKNDISISGMASVVMNTPLGSAFEALNKKLNNDWYPELWLAKDVLDDGIATTLKADGNIEMDSRLNVLHGGNFSADGANALSLTAGKEVNIAGTANIISGNTQVIAGEGIKITGKTGVGFDWNQIADALPDKYAGYGELAAQMGILDKLDKGVNGSVIAGGATLTAESGDITMEGMATAVVDVTAENVLTAVETMNGTPIMEGGAEDTTITAKEGNINLNSRLNLVNGGQVTVDAGQNVNMGGTFNVVSGNATVKAGTNIELNAKNKVGVDISPMLNGHYAELAEEMGMTDVLKDGVSSNIVAGGANLEAKGDVVMSGVATAIVDTTASNVIGAVKGNDLGELMTGGRSTTEVTAGNDIKLVSQINVVNGGNTANAGGVVLNAGNDVSMSGQISVVNRATVTAVENVKLASDLSVLKNSELSAKTVSFTGKNAEMTNVTFGNAAVNVLGTTLQNTADSTVAVYGPVLIADEGSIENYGSLTLENAIVVNSTIFSDSADTTVNGNLTLQAATLVFTTDSLTANNTGIKLSLSEDALIVDTPSVLADAAVADAVAGVNFVLSSDLLEGTDGAFELILFENATTGDFDKMFAAIQADEVSITLSDLNRNAIVSDVVVDYVDNNIVITGKAAIPEPTTATLSLLALAALAARRRRASR